MIMSIQWALCRIYLSPVSLHILLSLIFTLFPNLTLIFSLSQNVTNRFNSKYFRVFIKASMPLWSEERAPFDDSIHRSWNGEIWLRCRVCSSTCILESICFQIVFLIPFISTHRGLNIFVLFRMIGTTLSLRNSRTSSPYFSRLCTT